MKEKTIIINKLLKNDTLIYALGGLNEVGKNMYCFEHNEEIIIIDSGVMFPDGELLGVDYVIPDFSHLVKNEQKIKALIITHGHEDHIGSIPFLLLSCPSIKTIYAPKFAKALITKKLSERKIKGIKIVVIDDKSSISTKYFSIGFFNVIHSIPDSLGVLINTPNGRIVETGDFKFDLTPVGQNSDYQKMAYIGASGVDLLMSDSTNAEISGFSISEKVVSRSIYNLIKKAPSRLIISTFASNVYRLAQIVKAAVALDRKICVFGRSMLNVLEICRANNFFGVSDDNFIEAEELKNTPPEKTCIICTGSQGEPLAALSRIANAAHRHVAIIPNDTVIFSSSPIPGNAINVSGVVNLLIRQGANVIVNSPLTSLHTTGHASKEEQKLMMQLIKPKYFMPVHGEYKMLKLHIDSAVDVGIKRENCFMCSNGEALILRKHRVYKYANRIHADDIYVDGNDFSGLSTSVIKDRSVLADNGMVAVILSIDSRNSQILYKPTIITRGFIFIKENQSLIQEAEDLLEAKLRKIMKSKVSFNEIKHGIKVCLESFLYDKTKRNPLIIPVILNHHEAVNSYKRKIAELNDTRVEVKKRGRKKKVQSEII